MATGAPIFPPLDGPTVKIESLSSTAESVPIPSKQSPCARNGPAPLPRSILEEGGAFVSICMVCSLSGFWDNSLEQSAR